MNAKPSVFVGFSVILGCLILALAFGQQSEGQPPINNVLAIDPAATDAGERAINPSARYQIVIKGGELNQGSPTVFIFDPNTGQCWYRSTQHTIAGWTDMGSPLLQTEE